MGRRTAPVFLVLVVLITSVAAAGSWLSGYQNQLEELARDPVRACWLASIEQQMKSGRYQDAYRLIEGLEITSPHTEEAETARNLYPKVLLGQAEQYLDQEQSGYAQGRLEQLIKLYPESPEAGRARGLLPRALLAQVLESVESGSRFPQSANQRLLQEHPESPEATRAREIVPPYLLSMAAQDLAAREYRGALGWLDLLLWYYPESPEAVTQEYALRYDVYCYLLEESCARNISIIDAMFPGGISERLSSIGFAIRDISECPYDPGARGMWEYGINRISLFYPDAFASSGASLDYVGDNGRSGIKALSSLDGVILHEWGHAIDDFFLSDAERAQYRRIRNIPPGIPWQNYDMDDYDEANYWNSPNEDFANVFRAVMSGTRVPSSSPYGQVGDFAGMELWIVEAASN